MAQIGIFRMGDATKAAGDQLRAWRDQGLLDPKKPEEYAAALNYSTKAMEDLSDQAKVAGSALPQLQAAFNEAGNARKQLDSLMVEGMSVNRGFFTQFGQQLRSGASAWEAFKSSGLDALGRISDKLMSMAADKLFSSAFGGSTSGIGSLFGFGGAPSWSTDLGAGTGGMAFPMFANGGTLTGGWGVVGERGPELINVHKGGATIIPNHISKPFLPGFADGGTLSPNGMVSRLASASGGGDAPIVVQSGDVIIQGSADKETLAIMRQELARRDAELGARVVAAVNDGKKRRLIR